MGQTRKPAGNRTVPWHDLRECDNAATLTRPGIPPEGAPVLILGHTGDPMDATPHTPNSPVNHVDDFWSLHPQGVNFLLVDGSVRNISNTINPQAWWALGTRAGGEVVSDF